MSIPVTILLSAPGEQAVKLLRETRSRGLNQEERLNLYFDEGMVNRLLDESEDPTGMDRGTWAMEDKGLQLSPMPNEEDWNVLLYSSATPPMGWLDCIIPKVRKNLWEVTRIITLVDTKKAIQRPEARRWYQACIHFSDLVLLDNRDEVSPKEVKSFQEYFEKERYPCLFDLVKNGMPKNVSWMLDSQPRRLSLVFDPDELTGLDLPEWEDDEAEEEEEETDRYQDPYLLRNPNGDFALRIPHYPQGD